jgi:Protein of unknown function (DUF998)
VFVAVFLLEGAVRGGYRPLRHPVSSLALGPRGWIQAANFTVAGTPAAGAGLIAAAVFTTDPVSGYPPGTPDALTRLSRAGIAHNLAAVPVFLGLPAAALTCGWRCWRTGQRGFGLYSVSSGVAMLASMVLAGAGFGQSPRFVSRGGLFQRVSIITGFGWLTALSARALGRTPATAAARRQG